jgi:Protein of unknown function (DUF4238)
MADQGKSQRRKRHHYVPETYLRSWSDENDRVAMRRRGSKEVVRPTTKNVAVESDLYTIYGSGGEPDDFLEKALGDMVDGPASDMLSRLGEKYPPKASNDRRALSSFLAIQLVRTPDHISQVLFASLFAEYAGTDRISLGVMRSYMTDVHLGYPPSDREAQAATDFVNGALNMYGTLPTRYDALTILFRVAVEQLAPVLHDKAWSIEIDPEGRFITSDLPVTKYWDPAKRRRYEGVGIANADEIRFPIDPQHLLVMRPRYPEYRIIVPDGRVSAVNQQIAARCYRMIIAQPDLADSLMQLRLRDRSAALRFDIGPLIREDADGQLIQDGREVIHQYVEYEDE